MTGRSDPRPPWARGLRFGPPQNSRASMVAGPERLREPPAEKNVTEVHEHQGRHSASLEMAGLFQGHERAFLFRMSL